MFVSPTNLHCSQTKDAAAALWFSFVSPTNLHCSQTHQMSHWLFLCLFPLQIYTALKLNSGLVDLWGCLFPLQIYTALKPQIIQEKYLRNICVTFIVDWKHLYFNIKYIDLHPL